MKIENNMNNETAENIVSKNEAITDKGQERYDKLANSLSNAKARVSGWFKSGADRMGRLFKKGAVATLSTPEATAAGAKFVINKAEQGYDKTADVMGKGADYVNAKVEQAGVAVAEGGKYVANKTVEGGKYVAQKTVEGGKYVAAKTGEGMEYLGEKAEQMDRWAESAFESASDFTTEKVQATKQFISTKAEQVKTYTADKVLTYQAIISLEKDKRAEQLNAAKEKVSSKWNSMMEYSRNAIAAAELKRQEAQKIKDQKNNERKFAILQRKAEIHQAKLDKVKAKMAEMKNFGDYQPNQAAA